MPISNECVCVSGVPKGRSREAIACGNQINRGAIWMKYVGNRAIHFKMYDFKGF